MYPKEIPIYERAWMVAEAAHRGQSYDIYPYKFHLKQVVIVAESNFIPAYTQTASDLRRYIMLGCILHDVIEDSEITYEQLLKEFGETAAQIVRNVSDSPGYNRAKRKESVYVALEQTDIISKMSLYVKLCDRFANMVFSGSHSKRRFNMYIKEYPIISDRLSSTCNVVNEKTIEVDTEMNRMLMNIWGSLNELVIELEKQ